MCGALRAATERSDRAHIALRGDAEGVRLPFGETKSVLVRTQLDAVVNK